MPATTARRIPVREGMLELPAGPDRPGSLLGSRCRACGELFFIRRAICECCQGQDLEDVTLSSRGRLHSFTVMYYPAPPPYQPPEPFVPYGVGWVELQDGIVVYSLLTENDPARLHTGMEMELVIEPFSVDPDGNQLMTCRFRPA